MIKQAFMPKEYKEEKIKVFLDVNTKNDEPANTFLVENIDIRINFLRPTLNSIV